MPLVFATIFLGQVVCFFFISRSSGRNILLCLLAGAPFLFLMILLVIIPLFTGNKSLFIDIANRTGFDHGYLLLSTFAVYSIANIFAHFTAQELSKTIGVLNLTLLVALFVSGLILSFSIT